MRVFTVHWFQLLKHSNDHTNNVFIFYNNIHKDITRL